MCGCRRRLSTTGGTPSPAGAALFVGGPGGFCERHGKSYLTRRRRGEEGGGRGSLTGGAIPSAYRWAWFRWYSRASWKSQYASKSRLARSARSFRTASAPTRRQRGIGAATLLALPSIMHRTRVQAQHSNSGLRVLAPGGRGIEPGSAGPCALDRWWRPTRPSWRRGRNHPGSGGDPPASPPARDRGGSGAASAPPTTRGHAPRRRRRGSSPRPTAATGSGCC